jgi:hypothetical protein
MVHARPHHPLQTFANSPLGRGLGPAFVAGVGLFSLLSACPRKMAAHSGRSVPVCATQDCATGRTLDDGCTDDGRCASCVKPCPDLPPVEAGVAGEARDASPRSSPKEGGDGARDAAPAPPQQLRALAGEGERGIFWIPVKGDFPFEDLLLLRDGHYFTHLHDHPAAVGTWRMDGAALTLDGWMGDDPYVIDEVRVGAHELRGVAGGTPIVLRRLR